MNTKDFIRLGVLFEEAKWRDAILTLLAQTATLSRAC
jgi:hypothetical protein